jgi:DNA polymerase-1
VSNPLVINYYIPEPLRPSALDTLKAAKAEVFGDRAVRLNPVGFDETEFHLDNDFLCYYPLAQTVMEHRLRALADHPFGERTLYLDIETHSADDRWSMPIEEFFRLGQWAIGNGPVHLTTDLDVILNLIREAPGVVAANGHSFDFSALLKEEALDLALQGRLFDTMVHAALALPAPNSYVNRDGRKMIDASKPYNAMKWLSLDNVSFQLGLSGKIGDLTALAKKYGGYGMIPVEDPEYLEYARQDIVALREQCAALMRLYPPDDYAWREQLNAAIDAQNTRNGFRVDRRAARARVDKFAARKNEVLSELEEKYGFPTTGAQPWKSKLGKEALFRILADNGITEETRPDWQRTKTKALSLGGDVLIELTKDTEVEELGRVLAEIMGQRSLPQLALDCTQPDGRVHPEITALQRSGRKSTTKPGLTVWGSREGKDEDKAYFIASPGHKLVEVDYSNADARIVAALSGDAHYAERFEEGVDGHEVSGRIVFEDYDSDPKHYRNLSKPLGHGWNYGGQPNRLSQVAKIDLAIAEQFVQKMNEAYPDLIKWQNKVREEGNSGFVTNAWGRKMLVDKGRSFTQSPALYGQSGTRELMVDALIRMARRDVRLIYWLAVQVHDALVFDIPEEHLEWAIPAIKECMEVWWGGDQGQPIFFSVSVGEPSDTWREASHA